MKGGKYQRLNQTYIKDISNYNPQSIAKRECGWDTSRSNARHDVAVLETIVRH